MRKPWGVLIFFLLVITIGLVWLISLNGWRIESLLEVAGKKQNKEVSAKIEPVDFTGTYLVNQSNGSADTLEVRRVEKGYNLCWKTSSGETYYGNGLEVDGFLGAAYEINLPRGKRVGVAVYQKSGGGISGLKVGAGDDKYVWEKSEGAPDLKYSTLKLSGTWTLVGTNPNGSSYKGVLKVDQTGPTYAVEWQIEDPPLFGTGFTINNLFVTAYGTSLGLGVVIYKVKDKELSGIWHYSDFSRLAGIADIRTGQETATR